MLKNIQQLKYEETRTFAEIYYFTMYLIKWFKNNKQSITL